MVIRGSLLSDRDLPPLCNDTKLKMTEHGDATKLWCESAKVRRQGCRCDAETEEKNYNSGGWDFGPGEEYGTVGSYAESQELVVRHYSAVQLSIE
ncbi:uncharacterized protein G2W53_017662 [Senna tora]|uniref:Uncharacterized protein n=1 Tax=Senna tora TaxID=362788 RepID=A0A834TPM4_9FABA|nr:uncharacterized protein G2W53_017662 [Senna tora]